MPRYMQACCEASDGAEGPTRWCETRSFFALLRAVGWALLGVSGWFGALSPHTARADAPFAQAWLRVEPHQDPCIPAATFTREVERLLEGQPPDGVRVLLRAQEQGFVLELWHATEQHAVRSFPVLPTDCGERLRALALATALAVEHAVGSPSARAPAKSQPPRGATTRGALGLEAGASLGELPDPAPLLGVHARLERGAWVPIELRAFADVYPSKAGLAGGALNTRQITGALGTCAGGGRSRALRFDGCLGAEVGAVLGSGTGVPGAQRDTAGSGALNLGFSARWSPRPRLFMTLRVEGFARFWVPRFQVLGPRGGPLALRELPPAGGRLWFGLGWRSP